MKTQITFLFSFIFISLFSFAQTKSALKTDKIKVWGNCGMCKTTIEKAAKNAGATYAAWNEDAKILTVKYASTKTSVGKIEKKIASVGYDTQNETAPDDVYNNLHGCCQYDRKATEVKQSGMSCCKDQASCKKDCCTKADMSCCVGKDATHECCKDGKSCCNAKATTEKATAMNCCKDQASCKKDCCTKVDMSCCIGKNATHECCKEGKSCCAK